MDDGAPIKTTERLTPDAKRVVLLCAVTMLLASADRTIFSLGSLAIARDLSLSMSTVGLLQSAFFWGYGVTQVLGGVAADKFGGAKVLLMGLGLWSVGVAMIPAATLTPAPIAVIVAARVLFGAASGCTMPASAAAVASCVPAERRSSSLSLIFTFFNCGSAFGLLLAGSMIQTIGWQAVFLAFGAVGIAWSAIGLTALPQSARKGAKVSDEASGAGGAGPGWLSLPGWMYPQLGALAWCHVCINWGFFILQSWLPVYLAKELGFSLGGSGLVAALPWFLTAACSFSSGQIADFLVAKGWTRWKVRRLMMNIATIGPATALLLLPAAKSPTGAVCLLALMLGTQAVSIAGYHSYLQGRAAFQGWVVPGDNQHVGGHRRDSGELIRRVRRGDDGGFWVGLLGNRGRVRLERRGVEPQRERKGDVRVTRLFIIFRTVILFHDTVVLVVNTFR
jgi:ACS family sodium-dependent inorganic phosphate cotransporter